MDRHSNTAQFHPLPLPTSTSLSASGPTLSVWSQASGSSGLCLVPGSSLPCVLRFLSQLKRVLTNSRARYTLSSTMQPWPLPHRDPVPPEHDLKNHLQCLLATYFQYFDSLIEPWSFLQQAFKKNENLQLKRKIQDKLRPSEVRLIKG